MLNVNQEEWQSQNKNIKKTTNCFIKTAFREEEGTPSEDLDSIYGILVLK